jgi:DNA-binding transcriptional ArsR family regulator
MQAKREYRNRDETEVAVLDALVDRREEGMTVLELRSHVDADIDHLEAALGALKEDDLIEADSRGNRTVIRPDEDVVPEQEPVDESTLLDRVREWISL